MRNSSGRPPGPRAKNVAVLLSRAELKALEALRRTERLENVPETARRLIAKVLKEQSDKPS